MTSPPSPKRRRRRWLIVAFALVLVSMVSWWYWLNPMASIIAELHTILYHGGVPDPLFMARTFATAVVLLVIGFLLFGRVSKHLGEHL